MTSSFRNLSLLPLIIVLFFLNNLSFSSAVCHPSDKNALLHLQTHFLQVSENPPWDPKLDCCQDSPNFQATVKCNADGRVTDLAIQSISTTNGQIPPTIGDLPYLTSLTWWGSDLAGPLPVLSLSKLTNLKNIDLHINNLNGSLDFLSHLKSLVYVDLGNNVFSGPIPSSLAQLPHLQSLFLVNNKITGRIPEFLTRMKSLTQLDLGGNQLSGPIPPSFVNLPNLVLLDFTQNQLSGPIPARFGYFKNPNLVLNLPTNRFRGPIPKSLGLANITGLNLASNKLTGDASFLFGAHKTMLKSIDIGSNRLEFDFSNVELPPGLRVLYIYSNKIYGSLPKRLGQLPLTDIFVSDNKLCGPIPTGRRLKRFSPDRFAHNKCLCGLPLPPCKA